MAGSLAMVKAKHKSKGHGGAKGKAKHAHPVKRLTIEPTDNGGFSTTTEMHPPARVSENDPYMPGETQTGAHANYGAMAKHVKSMLKTDSEEQGPGEGDGGDPGSSEEAE